MTLSNDRDGGNSDTMGAGTTNGSTVNLQLASQLLSAISSGLASSSAGHPPYEPMNSSVAEAAGQMLLQHFGLQQAAQQWSETIANHSSPSAPTSHAAPPGVHDSKQEGHHGKTSGQQSSEKRHHHKHNHSDKAMPGTFSIVPCRARAMPPDHNSNSAVFKISRDVKHGEDLLCSFPQCRDGGVKFAYCLVCGIPVAKRNFRQRHDHGMANSKEKRRGEAQPHLNDINNASAVLDASQLLLPSIRRHQHEEERPRSRQNEDRRRSHEGNAPHRNHPFAQRDHEQGVGQRSDEAPMRNLVFQRRTGRGQNPETIVDDEEEERQRRWRELLRRRPLDTEGDAMSKWLLAVLEISHPGGNSSHPDNNAALTSNNNDRQHGSSESNEASNENESSSSYESSAGGSGANGGAGWNSSSSGTMGSGDSSGPSESSSGGGGHNERPQHQYVLPAVVSDFRNSTEESPSGSNTDAGGVDTSTNDPTSGSGSNDGDTLPREASSSLSAGSTMGSSESGSGAIAEKKNYTNHHDAKRPSSSSGNEQMHVEKKMKHR